MMKVVSSLPIETVNKQMGLQKKFKDSKRVKKNLIIIFYNFECILEIQIRNATLIFHDSQTVTIFILLK